MKILLIAPASGNWHGVGQRRFFNGRTFRFSLLSLLSVAAATPEDADVTIVDEQLDRIPWDDDIDLVGITCMTALAPRAYEIAAGFRSKGIPVVLGGMHPTLCPQEAVTHADAIVAGSVEAIWPHVLKDTLAGHPGGIYSAPLNDLDDLKPLPRSLLDTGRYAAVHPVQATRGCPKGCEFCAISAFHHAQQLRRPVQDVVNEVAQLPGRSVIFVDDNLTADRDYARRLFEALIPLNKHWITQSALEVAADEPFVALAAEAGCVGMFVGMETFSDTNLSQVGKEFNKVAEYRERIETLHRHGIAIEAGIVFGFDGDRVDVFSSTLRQLDALQIDAIQASILTPIPGTPLAERYADRITDRNWANYDFHHAVFRPAHMSEEQLKAGHDWVTHEFYAPWRIARRLARHARRPGGLATLPYLAAINAAYYGRTRAWGIRGWDPAEPTHSCLHPGRHQTTLPAARPHTQAGTAF